MAAQATFDRFVGKSIAEICDCKFASPHQNHCAHFVSHALGIKIPTLCGDMAFATRGKGATIRCNELFNGLDKRGAWALRTKDSPLLIFCTKISNMDGNTMGNHPRKHVGICTAGGVYNFSNGHHKVVKDASPEAFFSKMDHTYGGETAIFFAVPA